MHTPLTVYPSGGDDTANIQLFDQAAANNGTSLQFASGVYNINNTGLTMHCSWKGLGGATLRAMAQAWTFGVPMVAGASNVVLSNLTFDVGLPTLNPSYNYPVVSFVGVTNWVMLGCTVKNIISPQIGVYGSNTSGFGVRDNTFIMPTPTNTFNQAIDFGIGSGAVTDGYITGNLCQGTGMDLAGTDLNVSFNTVVNWKFGGGITVQPLVGCSGFVIANNNCSGGSGLDVNSTYPSGIESWCANSSITGNVCHNNSGSGITVGAPNCTVTGNTCVNNGQSGSVQGGIALYSITGTAANNCTVAGNTLTDTQTTKTQAYGVWTDATAGALTGNVVASNMWANNKTGTNN